MATAEPENNPSPSLPREDGTEETGEIGQEIVSPEAYIKHPLQNRWSLWFLKIDKSKTWQANLRLISKFDTVEDFWAVYNHIQLSSNLMSGCDYSLFKDGIEPMWEDERNKHGGRWLITLNRQQRRLDLDRFWLETLEPIPANFGQRQTTPRAGRQPVAVQMSTPSLSGNRCHAAFTRNVPLRETRTTMWPAREMSLPSLHYTIRKKKWNKLLCFNNLLTAICLVILCLFMN
ncbi:eukaryotic translation initiation factor 4eb isoform X1 [Syngnathoides biaculeatus]|uniref:eukaryotic translation initiation factor 4eb isoform X1 n=1 Tax=Syngnathoides biaculeatus TaxID=300417 RepID=UPI002ADDFCCB|nr:eukaryotic translation initiation factor 4eb isoform X1 [Syngnathoides biaculeatus]